MCLIEGSSFISNRINIKDELIIPIIDLFSSFVTFNNKVKYTNYDNELCKVLLLIIVYFVFKSCINSGF